MLDSHSERRNPLYSLINYADAEYKINYRRALAALLRDKDMVELQIEANRSQANG